MAIKTAAGIIETLDRRVPDGRVADVIRDVVDSVPTIGATALIGIPAVAPTNNALVRWDGVTGQLVQNSAVTVDDTTGLMTFPVGTNAGILAPQGAAGTPAYSFANDPNTGMFNGAADAIYFTLAGTSRFAMIGAAMQLASVSTFGWSSGAIAAANDLTIRRFGAASVTFGAADAASPVAQVMGVQNVVAGTTDVAGANWTHNGSRGTGSGAGGSIIFQTALAGSTGSSQNALVARLTIGELNVIVAPATATPANGSTAARLLFGTTAGFGIYYGSAAPTVSAAKGSLYLRSDGDAGTNRAYINTDGGTTWTAINTVG